MKKLTFNIEIQNSPSLQKVGLFEEVSENNFTYFIDHRASTKPSEKQILLQILNKKNRKGEFDQMFDNNEFYLTVNDKYKYDIEQCSLEEI